MEIVIISEKKMAYISIPHVSGYREIPLDYETMDTLVRFKLIECTGGNLENGERYYRPGK